jgi:hypothetical protein
LAQGASKNIELLIVYEGFSENTQKKESLLEGQR